MKSVILLSAAAYAGATSLRGDGVEEIGDQIEHFPSDEFYVHVDRRLLTDVDEDAEARAMMEDYFDEWPEEDVVGHLVEDEDQIYVDAYERADGEEDRYEDMMPVGEAGEGEVFDAYPEKDSAGAVVDEVEDEGADHTAVKEYAPNPDSATVSFPSVRSVFTPLSLSPRSTHLPLAMYPPSSPSQRSSKAPISRATLTSTTVASRPAPPASRRSCSSSQRTTTRTKPRGSC